MPVLVAVGYVVCGVVGAYLFFCYTAIRYITPHAIGVSLMLVAVIGLSGGPALFSVFVAVLVCIIVGIIDWLA